MMTLTSFHLFPELPNELQNLIWEYTFYLDPTTIYRVHHYVFIEDQDHLRLVIENLSLTAPSLARPV